MRDKGGNARSHRHTDRIDGAVNTRTTTALNGNRGQVPCSSHAQIHAGGRGKGTFANGLKGGVHVVKSAKEARDVAAGMLSQTLMTHQTGPAGRVVNKVLVAEAAEIAREIYLAILRDRAEAAP